MIDLDEARALTDTIDGLNRIRDTMREKWSEYGVDVLERAVVLLSELTAAREALAKARQKTIDDACEAVWIWASGHEDRFEAMNDLTHEFRMLARPTQEEGHD